MKIKLTFLALLLFFASCSKRNLTYFSDLKNQAVYTEQVTSVPDEPLIQPGDLLGITVTSLNPEANALFNRGGELRSVGSAAVGSSTSATANEGFLVDRNGYIEYPVLGSVHIGGLNKSEVKAKLSELLTTYLKEPVISIRYLNYRITVLGEVNRPSTLVVPSEQITILEALGMAGDLTVFGKRENVLIIRQGEGVRTMARLDLNNKEVLNSPYFYLQPNDVIYVEAVMAKGAQASMARQNISLVVSLLSVVVTIVTLSRVL